MRTSNTGSRRKADAVIDMIKGKTTPAEIAPALIVVEVEQWANDFVSAHPRDAEARHSSPEKDMLIMIGDRIMQWSSCKCWILNRFESYAACLYNPNP